MNSTCRCRHCNACCPANRGGICARSMMYRSPFRPARPLSLVGESGCGKSTIARLCVGLYTPKQGEIRFEGMTLAEARKQGGVRRQMNMIFQDPYASLNPRWRVTDIIAEPIRTFGLENDAAIGAAARGHAADAGRPGAVGRRQIPARVLRRAAPACVDRAGACRPSRCFWCATNPPARWTFRCRRKS